ncbi:DUF502 domain-containing protein [Haloferacaceae archaeon DSL9]
MAPGRSVENASSVVDAIRRAAVTGLAVLVPLVITLLVVMVALNAIYGYLDRFSDLLSPYAPSLSLPVIGVIAREYAVELATPAVFLLLVLALGVVVNASHYGERAFERVDRALCRLPGIGAVYESFRRVSDVVVDDGNDNFRDVKLVEFPTDESYTIAFLTTETPERIREATGHDSMQTLFLPLAPNPVMGGHVVNVPAERVYDVDISVEEAIQAIVTSGVALAESPDVGAGGVSSETMRKLNAVDGVDGNATARVENGDERRSR